MKYNEMSTEDVIKHINVELLKNRTMKDIEENDFGENKGVIQKRLNRKGYVKINNQFVSAKNNTTTKTTNILHDKKENTTQKTTEIIQTKSNDNRPKQVFSKDKLDKLEEILNIDVDVLKKIINEYNTKNTTASSMKILDETTKVTSIRINQELYGKVKKYAKDNKLQLVDIFSAMMIDYLQRVEKIL